MDAKNKILICRTCLNSSLPPSRYISLCNYGRTSPITIKDALEIFAPEMDLDIGYEDALICDECLQALEIAHRFKNKCLDTEKLIYDHLRKNNIYLGNRIYLSRVKGLTSPGQGELMETELSKEESQDNIIFNESAVVEEDDIQNLSAETIKLDSDDSQPTPETSSEIKTERGENSKNECQKRSFTCDQCEYKAYRPDLLKSHKQKHYHNILGVKEYKCAFCMYSTLRKRALDRHQFTHKGHSSHFCDVCNKNFAEKYQLKLHSLTHTGGELPHKCSECGRSFLTQSYLKSHVEVKHLSKLAYPRYYKCQMCDSSFSDKRGLEAHKFTHGGAELPFQCDKCGFKTAWKRNLKKHLENKH